MQMKMYLNVLELNPSVLVAANRLVFTFCGVIAVLAVTYITPNIAAMMPLQSIWGSQHGPIEKNLGS